MCHKILNQENAIRIVLKQLKMMGYKFEPNGIQYINKGRYTLVRGEPRIAIMLKEEPFFNFGNKFRSQGEKGVGDSVNVEHLMLMHRMGVKAIFTIFRDGKIYRIGIQELLLNSHRWKQKEGTIVRSFSIHHYKRVN